jgi:hypothetical protein
MAEKWALHPVRKTRGLLSEQMTLILPGVSIHRIFQAITLHGAIRVAFFVIKD